MKKIPYNIQVVLGPAERLRQECIYKNIVEPVHLTEKILGKYFIYYEKSIYLVDSNVQVSSIDKCCGYSNDKSVYNVFSEILDEHVNENNNVQDINFQIFGYEISIVDGGYKAVATKKVKKYYKNYVKVLKEKSFDIIFEKLSSFKKENLNVTIHIGLPKTGTKYLQNNIFDKIENVYYMKWDEFYFTHVFLMLNYLNSYVQKEEVKQKIEHYYDTFDDYHLLISDESITTAWAYGKNLYTTAKALKYIFPEARILLSLREQYPILESLYCQAIREGAWLSVNSFIRYDERFNIFNRIEHTTYPHIDVDYFKYDDIIDVYKKEFGSDSIKILLYEKFKYDSETYIRDLSNYFNEDINLNSISSPVNVRPGVIELFLLKILNRFIYKPNRQIGLVYEQPFLSSLDYIFDNKDKLLPMFGKPMIKRIINNNLRTIVTKLREYSRGLTVRAFAKNIDSLYYKAAHPISKEAMKNIRIKYSDHNIFLEKEYGLEIQKYWYRN